MSRDSFVTLPRGAIDCLQFVIVVFSDHTYLLFLRNQDKDIFERKLAITLKFLSINLNVTCCPKDNGERHKLKLYLLGYAEVKKGCKTASPLY